jgi:hypothetical protein
MGEKKMSSVVFLFDPPSSEETEYPGPLLLWEWRWMV